MRFLMTIFLTMLSISASASEEKVHSSEPPVTPNLHLDWRDTLVAPSENFYAYANGVWQKENPIPAEYSSWSNFNILQDKVQNLVHKILINAANDKKSAPGSIEQKVGDFYFSGMDEKAINQLGIEPLQPELARIDTVEDMAGLQKLIPHLQQIGVDVLFGFTSMQDFKDSQKIIGAVEQGGLGLPTRDYYLKSDKKFQEIRTAYVQHIAKMFELLGHSSEKARAEAATIMKIETTLAEGSMSQIEMRNPHAIYHMMDLQQLTEITPNFSWEHYLNAIEHPEITQINVAMPHFFQVMNKQLKTVSIEEWRIYLRWHLMDAFAAYLSEPFVNENFRMQVALSGVKKLLPRWKRVLYAEDGALGFAVGKLYVEKYFPPSSKQAAKEILQDIRLALQHDLQTLSWMTPITREAALKKLSLMEERIGYPDKWRDYSSLVIDRGPYVLNIIRANEFLFRRDLNKIGKPVDRNEWEMPPQTINAYYNPSMNNLNIPAGILQPPFFDPNAPAAVNFGGIGFVMGHEMTHGFDDEGAQFDGLGNLNNWWTVTDLKKFQAATQCIVNQFSQYKVEDNFPVQGKLVSGEATADLGGLTLAYHAFRASKFYNQAKTIDSLTPEQQLFLSAAHVWAVNMRPEQARNLVTFDPHPPMVYRVNGTLANMPQFQEAYNILQNSSMVNKKRCVIW